MGHYTCVSQSRVRSAPSQVKLRDDIARELTSFMDLQHVSIRSIRDLFRHRSEGILQLLAKGASATFAIGVFFSCVNFGLSLLLARILGVRGYGAYSYAIAWTTLLDVLGKMGFELIITRDAATYLERKNFSRLFGPLRIFRSSYSDNNKHDAMEWHARVRSVVEAGNRSDRARA